MYSKNVHIIIKKSERLLQLWQRDTLAVQYPVGLGFSPQGDKQKEGDGNRREGSYYICMRNEKSRFYKSFGLSYPNSEDAKKGLEAGLIDITTYDLINQKINESSCPPWHTALGGEICIHGHGSHSDWTQGCIAVENSVMDVLWQLCPLGTAVIILP